MPSCKSIYEPREDSALLEGYVKQYAFGRVLDVGTGSGMQAIAAAQNKNVSSVLAIDIQKGVIENCKTNIKSPKIRFVQSDLFKNIKGKFDTIIFNPPYLPQELKLRDLTIEGGKKGYEIIQKFIGKVNKFLAEDGIILMVFSSLTKKEKVEGFIKNNLLDFEELGKVHIFFEDIYAYLLKKSKFLKRLEGNGIANARHFAKGHRGLLLTGTCKNRKVAIKAKNPKSAAIGRIENEAKWLIILNKHNIGPKLLFWDKEIIVYKFIEGDFIIDYIKKSGVKAIKKIIKDIFRQMLILDRLNIDKEEMHHPYRHIIISKGKPCLIDFERVHYSKSPKNVTQFCQFIPSSKISEILAKKGIHINKSKIIELAKVYKSSQSSENFNKIINAI